MQYLNFTSNSNLLSNVLKNVTDMIFSAFASRQIMCVSWLTFFSLYGSINWEAKIIIIIHGKIAAPCSQNTTKSEIKMSVWSPIMDHYTSSTH